LSDALARRSDNLVGKVDAVMMEQRNERPASQGPQVTTQYRLADYNVLGVFNSMDDARRAIETLGRAGIEGKHITLTGDAPDEAATRAETAEADAALMSRWFRTNLAWGAVGAVIGALLGIPIGALVISVGLDSDITAENLFISALMGGIFLGIIAALIGVVYPMQAGDTWELTYQKTYGDKAIVGVHSADPREVEKARDTMQKHGALNVRTADSQTRPQDAADRVARAAH
jgi:hypothetical protein